MGHDQCRSLHYPEIPMCRVSHYHGQKAYYQLVGPQSGGLHYLAQTMGFTALCCLQVQLQHREVHGVNSRSSH